jgi:hypothetical protein
VTTDHLALVADRLDARLDLHRSLPDGTPSPEGRSSATTPDEGIGVVEVATCSGRRCDRERGRTG